MLTVRRIVFVLVLTFATVSLCRAADVAELVKKFPAITAPEREALSAQILKEGAPGIQAICKMLVEPNKGDDTKARFALEGLAIHASRPGADGDRKLFAQAIASELSGNAPAQVKAFLLVQLRLAAGDEQVADIAKLLSDKELSDQAAQTLLTIRTPSVASALRAALATVKEGPRVAVIDALGSLRDKDSAAEILKDVESTDIAIKNAALHALAVIGDADAAPAMAKAAKVDNGSDRGQALQAALTLAQRLVELGKKSEAAAICRSLTKTEIGISKESHLQCAALNILASADAEAAFDDLKAALQNESPEVRATALGIAGSIPGKPVTLRWAAELKGAEPKFAVGTLGVLERRGDAAAFPAVAEAAKSADAAVRAAAYRAAVIGGKDALPLLLMVLGQEPAKNNADEQAAAKAALLGLKGEGLNAAFVAALHGAPTPIRKVLIGALADHNAFDHLSDLLAATSDTDAGIRAEAYESVGKLGGLKELPQVLTSIVKTDKDEDRANAEKAAVLIASHVQDKSAVAALVSTAMNGASTAARQGLLRVLGKTGGPEALGVLKPALKDADAAVVDTAVRELANWPDSSAQSELLVVAKDSKELPHNVLALNGYVRLLDAESKRPTNEFLPRYKAALELCRRPEEKKRVISGIQNVKTPEGAAFVEELMADESLREEACNAAMNIAKELAKSDKKAARGVFEKVIATTKRADLKKNAQSELDKVK